LSRYEESQYPEHTENIAKITSKVTLFRNQISVAQSKRVQSDVVRDSDMNTVAGKKNGKGVELGEEERRANREQIDEAKGQEMEALDGVIRTVKDMKQIAVETKITVEDHNRIIVQNQADADVAIARLDTQNKMLNKLLKAAKEKKSWVILLLLCLLLVILVVIAFALP